MNRAEYLYAKYKRKYYIKLALACEKLGWVHLCIKYNKVAIAIWYEMHPKYAGLK